MLIHKKSIRHILGLLVSTVCLSACSPQTEKGYATHPKAVQAAIANCPEKAPSKKVSCEDLSTIAARINSLAYKLKVDQQAYGKDILTLQETITEQRSTLEKYPNQVALQRSLKSNEQNLQEHLAVVKWLASPGR